MYHYRNNGRDEAWRNVGPSDKQQNVVDFLFKLIFVLTAIITLLIPVVLAAMDFLNIDAPFLTPSFIARFSAVDFPEKEGANLSYNLRTVAIFAVAILGAILVHLYRTIRRKDRKTREISKQFKRFSDNYASHIVASLRKMEELKREVESGDSSSSSELYERLIDLNGQFLSSVATKLAWMARVYTGHACHVSIKVYSPHNGGIRTFARDSITSEARAKVDEKHGDTIRRYDTNYVFKEIIEKPSCHHFISNNLAKHDGYYNQSNEHWSDYYNRCLVVPIATSLEPESEAEILGFLCIDSMKGRFENDYFLSIVMILSRFISVQFVSVLSTVELRRQRAQDDVSNQ